MAPKIALQLYTVRKKTETDFEGIVRKIAAMGYQGVETAGFGNSNPEKASKLFKELGLTVVGAHSGFPVGDDKNAILDTTQVLNCNNVVVAAIGPDTTKDMDSIKKLVAKINESAANARERGLGFAIHNHWWEYLPVDGKLAVDHMLDLMDKQVLLELDTYWIKTAGQDPAARVAMMGSRSPFLHIKDGPCEKNVPQTIIGEGIMDFAAIRKAGGTNTEWWIMEADEVVGDELAAVDKSRMAMAELLK